MLAALIITAVVAVSLGSLVKHLLDLNALHPTVVPLMLLAGALPGVVCWQVLEPGEPVASYEVKALHDELSLELPEGTAIMVTAELGEEPLEPDANSQKTAYALNVRGKGWEDSLTGTIKRETTPDGPDIDPGGEKAIRGEGRRRAGRLGEDLQDRHDVSGAGAATLEVTNWSGTAASRLVLEVVRAPIRGAYLWAAVVLLTLVGLGVELRKNAESFASWLAFLSSWAVFLRDGVTPLDDWQEVGLALAPAALFGFGGVSALTYVTMKVLSLMNPEAETAAPEPKRPTPAQAAAPTAVPAPTAAPQPSPTAAPTEAPASPAPAPATTPETLKPDELAALEAVRSRKGAAARRRAQQSGADDDGSAPEGA